MNGFKFHLSLNLGNNARENNIHNQNDPRTKVRGKMSEKEMFY